MATTPFRRPRRLSFVLLLSVWIVLPVLSVRAEPVVEGGAEAFVQAALSTPTDKFWARYPQYAAENEPFVRSWWGIRDDSWRIAMEFDLFQQYVAAHWRYSNLPLPDADSARQFPVEYHGLRMADLEYDFRPLVLSFGRNKVHWGPTQDSLIFSDQVPFLDRIAFRLPMGDWALDYLVASPETRSPDADGKTGVNYTFSTYQVAHRLSWRSGGLEIGFTEEAILDRNEYEGTDPNEVTGGGAYRLTDFLPFSSIHETDVRPFNTWTVIDVSWRFGDWKLALESGLDDFDARVFGISDDSIPNIPANIFEVSWARDDWSWVASVGNTHYLWGNYNTKFGKAVYRIFLDNGVQEQPLSSPYGPGATWATFSGRYQGPVGFDAKAEIWGVLQGVDLENTAYEDSTPAQKYNLYLRTHLFATLSLGAFTFSTGPEFLLANQALTERWWVKFSTKTGSPRLTGRRRRGGAGTAPRATRPLRTSGLR